MIYLLSDEGRQAMKVAAGKRLLYAFDFDGTLAPISPDRHSVQVSRTVLEWLHALTKRAPCAVVSGRSLADLAPRIDGTQLHLIGNHGIEGPCSSPADLGKAERACSQWKRELVVGLAQLPVAQGAEVEDKRYSLTVHLRRTVDPDRAGTEVFGLLQSLMPTPHIVVGTYSINILPSGQEGKGVAAMALMTQLGRDGLLYIGDEETDETVFAMPNGVVLGIRIGHSTSSHAKFYVKGQEEIEAVLRCLVHDLDSLGESLNHAEPRAEHSYGQTIIHDRMDWQTQGS